MKLVKQWWLRKSSRAAERAESYTMRAYSLQLPHPSPSLPKFRGPWPRLSNKFITESLVIRHHQHCLHQPRSPSSYIIIHDCSSFFNFQCQSAFFFALSFVITQPSPSIALSSFIIHKYRSCSFVVTIIDDHPHPHDS